MTEQLDASLTCSSCGLETDHELVYVGRLLHSTTCTSCGFVVRHEQRDLMGAYLRDLEHRLLTKPARLARQAARQPGRFAASLPAGVLRQPHKIWNEVRTLLRRP